MREVEIRLAIRVDPDDWRTNGGIERVRAAIERDFASATVKGIGVKVFNAPPPAKRRKK